MAVKCSYKILFVKSKRYRQFQLTLHDVTVISIFFIRNQTVNLKMAVKISKQLTEISCRIIKESVSID
jgi:hypothetical protein